MTLFPSSEYDAKRSVLIEAHKLLHRLWTKTPPPGPGYDKSEWQRLEKLLCELASRPPNPFA